jgi:hypothetical protein
MPITVEIKPETHAALSRQASLLGRTLEQHASILLEQELCHKQTSRNSAQETESTSRESLEDVFARARGLADDLDITRDLSHGRPIDLS